MLKVANSVINASQIAGVLPVANGGTNASTASITSFNNITGFTASGTTGTTSTKLVFDTTPTLVGDVNLSTGNLVIGTSGKGIDFSATTSGAGTMTSELFSDYEEGTWTPAVVGGSTNPTITYTSTSGTYTKAGRLVVCRANIQVNSASGGTGECGIDGLPFTASQNGGGYVVYGNGWGTAVPEACYISGTAARAYFTYKNSATSWTEISVSSFGTGASIWFIIIYEA